MGCLDTILVGFNEVDFAQFARTQQQFSHSSGGYNALTTSSVLLGDRRVTYMDLLNATVERATGLPSALNAFEMPSLGVAYLASYLMRRGFKTGIINFFNHGRAEFADMLHDSPRSVSITTTYYVDDEPIKQIISFIREHNPSVPVIVGGPRITNVCAGPNRRLQDRILHSAGADIYINDSQGESTLAAVLETLRTGGDLAKVPNLIYASREEQTGMARTARHPESNDLDENAIDWSYFDESFYAPTTYMRTSRSCSFSCAFCDFPARAGKFTVSDPETVLKEMRYLSERGVKRIIFVDDTFNVPLPRFKKLCRMMADEHLDFEWISFFRCSNSDDEAFDLMAEAGCKGVFLGIESGDQRILKNMNKFARTDRYAYGIQELRKRGISTLASLVLGFPGETEESVHNTMGFINQTQPDFYTVELYYHNSLAPIEAQRDQYGLTGSGYSWRHDTMSWEEAASLKSVLVRGIDGPAVLPLYGLSIWSLPYVQDKGFTMPQIKRFLKGATNLMIRSLDVDYMPPEPELDAMARLLGDLPRGLVPGAPDAVAARQ
jgi:radical SAM PhpK family P-methyltransferase